MTKAEMIFVETIRHWMRVEGGMPRYQAARTLALKRTLRDLEDKGWVAARGGRIVCTKAGGDAYRSAREAKNV